jgi:hypothetical protein
MLHIVKSIDRSPHAVVSFRGIGFGGGVRYSCCPNRVTPRLLTEWL